MFKCKNCETLKEENRYLKELVSHLTGLSKVSINSPTNNNNTLEPDSILTENEKKAVEKGALVFGAY